MNREPVSSSNIASIGYDPQSQTLEVEFRTGAVYQYSGVPPREFEDFKSAGSHGTHFHHHIRSKYSGSRA